MPKLSGNPTHRADLIVSEDEMLNDHPKVLGTVTTTTPRSTTTRLQAWVSKHATTIREQVPRTVMGIGAEQVWVKCEQPSATHHDG